MSKDVLIEATQRKPNHGVWCATCGRPLRGRKCWREVWKSDGKRAAAYFCLRCEGDEDSRADWREHIVASLAEQNAGEPLVNEDAGGK